MTEYSHYISGFFANRDDAESTLLTLVERGLPRDRLQIFKTDTPSPDPAPKDDSNAVLKDVLVDGTIGAAVGTGIGALAEVALVAANVSLFIASPLLAPLMLLGWGASIGGLIGATSGAVSQATPDAQKGEGWLSALVRDAIAGGQIVLVVRAQTEQEAAIARDVIQTSVGDYGDTHAA